MMGKDKVAIYDISSVVRRATYHNSHSFCCSRLFILFVGESLLQGASSFATLIYNRHFEFVFISKFCKTDAHALNVITFFLEHQSVLTTKNGQ